VSTRKSLDREQQAEYTLEITARNGSSSSKALLVINIDDVNDHDPLFLREKYQVYTGSIYDIMDACGIKFGHSRIYKKMLVVFLITWYYFLG
jgi:hypothetical protein